MSKESENQDQIVTNLKADRVSCNTWRTTQMNECEQLDGDKVYTRNTPGYYLRVHPKKCVVTTITVEEE
jgi:hypothetical protein